MLKRLRRLDEAESQLLFAYPHAIDEYEKADIQYNLACVYAMQKRHQDMLDACAIVRNPKCDKALKGTGERLTSPSKS